MRHLGHTTRLGHAPNAAACAGAPKTRPQMACSALQMSLAARGKVFCAQHDIGASAGGARAVCAR
jgi:hypothetical protein